MPTRGWTGGRIAPAVTGCASCYAWGMTYAQGRCHACYRLSDPHYRHVLGECGACARTERLTKGFCRLCWCQARLERTTGTCTPLLPLVRRVRWHQLFLAGLADYQPPPRTAARRYGQKGRPRKPPPAPAARPHTRWTQPPLFGQVLPRSYRYGHLDLRRDPLPDNPWLGWGLHLAHQTAETRGWDPVVRRKIQRTLVMLLAGHTDGDLIRVSDFRDLARRHAVNVEYTVEILTTMGVLDDDRPRTFDLWLAANLDHLTPGIGRHVRGWALSLHDGGTRTRPRRPATAVAYLGAIRPAVTHWSDRHDHLREVTRADITAFLDTLTGSARDTAVTALRSLFGWATRTRVVFANPTSRVRYRQADDPIWQPLRPEELARTVTAAGTPQARLMVALAAVHAARPGHIRALQLIDVDLGNHRLTIAGRDRPLDALSRQLLLDWLDHRRSRWPNTANPHLLISFCTALGLGPVSATYLTPALRGLPATIERLRIDRQLEEALTTGADPLHLAAVFGVSDTTAIRYATNARQLLTRPHETPTGPPATRVSKYDTEPDGHPGSR